jgi:hypothetical protein
MLCFFIFYFFVDLKLTPLNMKIIKNDNFNSGFLSTNTEQLLQHYLSTNIKVIFEIISTKIIHLR